MARPTKDGLDYFPKDTDFYKDRKIRALIGRFGCDGAALYDYILCEVYRDKGYYTTVDATFRDVAAVDLCMSPEKIGLIMDYLVNQSMLLDGTLFNRVKVLTSHGIQTRYQAAVRQRGQKRGIAVDGELWLLNEAETESFIQVRHSDSFSEKNPRKSENNRSKSQKNALKESKVKESKVKESKEDAGCGANAFAYYLDKVNAKPGNLSIEELKAYVEELGHEVCIRAMDIALDEKTAKWGFIKAVLQRYMRDNVKCLADAIESDARRSHTERSKVDGTSAGGDPAGNTGSGRWNLKSDL